MKKFGSGECLKVGRIKAKVTVWLSEMFPSKKKRSTAMFKYHCLNPIAQVGLEEVLPRTM